MVRPVDRGFVRSLAFYAVSVLLVSMLIVGYAAATRDVSWIDRVENYIEREEWQPDKEYVPLNDWSFFLHEDGREEYFFLYSQSEFINYIRGLTERVDRQIENSVSKEAVDEILATSRVMAVVHRFPKGFGHFGLSGSSEVAYFILDDESGKGLEGLIIMQDRRAGEYSHYGIWQITDWPLW